MNISKNNISTLSPNEVFVYGANEAGIHGAGGAYLAYSQFGAKWGKYGYDGQAYGIPTKSDTYRVLTVNEIMYHVHVFIQCVKAHPDKDFLLTEIGCGLAGYNPSDIAPLFRAAIDLPNLYFPQRFADILSTYNIVEES